MRVVLFKGHGPIASLIRWQTRSEYSHAAIWTDEGTLIESRGGTGVQAIPDWQPKGDEDVFAVNLNANETNRLVGFLSEQVGKKYDYLMVARFVSRKQENRSTTGRWFCSELVFAAFQQAGRELLSRTDPWEVSPGLLARSPFLNLVPITWNPLEAL